MESANLRHHQQQQHQHELQEQFVVSSSSLATPSFFPTGNHNNNNSWNPNLILNTSNFDLNVNEDLTGSRNLRQNSDMLAPPLNVSMIQDLGFHWANNNNTGYIKHEQQNLHDQFHGIQVSEGEVYSNSQSSVGLSSKGYFSQIPPSTNISSFNPPPSLSFLSTLGMNLQALDLLNSTEYGVSTIESVHNNHGIFKETPYFPLEHLQESSHWSTNSDNKVSSFMNGVIEPKRSNNISEPKVSQTPAKKPRVAQRTAITTIKVRQEKLGDRIAALQQLVAPFGKTDTASVLMEAIGYIKFLQDQVETLSVPYMKMSRKNSHRTTHQGSCGDDIDEETKPDLRSRGLCLVPLSCTSYITNENVGIWPHPNFGGRT
ncbi:hypothetical protein GIB67_004887 [Kingdonia uniflora]|uniref:BHLH domain-containing protein n=1 Tax=Kingdonia uniflora TaxID=39325 RepID=A0A7J7LNY8_9MAGN|nr:hypothetical protein GIB67_004887 [Kingdonia uniflora]